MLHAPHHAARRDDRNVVLATVETPRVSSARDDAALLSARAPFICDEDARELAGHLRDKVHERMNNFLHARTAAPRADEEEKEKEAQGRAGRSAARFFHVRRE